MSFKFSKGVWYITMKYLPLSVIKPDGFIIGTLYELRQVSGCISIKKMRQNQLKDQYDRGKDFGGRLDRPQRSTITQPDILCMEALIQRETLLGLVGRSYYDRQ